MKVATIVLACTISLCSQAAAQKPVFIKAEGATAQTPFSEAVRVGNMLYVSGMIGSLPGQFKLIEGGTQAETRQILSNLKGALEKHGTSMDNVVKCLVMLVDINEWAKMNEVYVTFFPNNKPARSAIGVASLVLNANVEIECIAVMPE
jgi:reactive intermediate/imine deaminase